MEHELDVRVDGKIDVNLVSILDTPKEQAEFMAKETEEKFAKLLRTLYDEQINPDKPGEFFFTVGYRNRPK